MSPYRNYIARQGQYDGILDIPIGQRIKSPLSRDCQASVIIPAYNEEQVIIHCLDALIHQQDHSGSAFSLTSFEVIVVNNNSTDRTHDIIREWIVDNNIPNVYVIDEKTKGVSAARKRGFDEVVYRYVDSMRKDRYYLLSADADNIIDHHWIERMLQEFHQHDGDMVVGKSVFDLSSLEQCPNLSQFLSFKERVEEYVKNIYIGRAEGKNFGITLDMYAKVGGIKLVDNFYDHDFYPLPTDDWVLSAEVLEHGGKLNRCDARVVLNSRKLLTATRQLLAGTLYLGEWEILASQQPVALDFTNRELHIAMRQQLRGVLAYQMLMNIFLEPGYLKSEGSMRFLEEELTKDVVRCLPVVHAIFPKAKFDIFYYSYVSWFLYFRFGDAIHRNFSRVFPEYENSFVVPKKLKDTLASYASDWQKDQAIYAYCVGNPHYLGKYFGGWF
ncbi:MAG: glycosyltransferase family A protein, partial [Patescibacteria group bacterium]